MIISKLKLTQSSSQLLQVQYLVQKWDGWGMDIIIVKILMKSHKNYL